MSQTAAALSPPTVATTKYPVPAAARALVGDALAQPVLLHRADSGMEVQDQAEDLLAAPFVIGGLIAGETRDWLSTNQLASAS